MQVKLRKTPSLKNKYYLGTVEDYISLFWGWKEQLKLILS